MTLDFQESTNAAPLDFRPTPASPAPSQPQKGGIEGAADFITKDIWGIHPQQNGGVLGDIFQNTLGSKGVAGTFQLPGRVISSFMTAGADQPVANSAADLAHITTKLLEKARSLPDGDPHKTNLMATAQENQRAIGIANNTLDSLDTTQTSWKEALGTGANAALTLAPYAPATKFTAFGKTFNTLSGQAIFNGELVATQAAKLGTLFPQIANGLTKTLSAGTKLIPRMVTSGLYGSAVQSAYNLANTKPVTENIGTTSLISAGIPAVTTGLARTLKYLSSVVSGTPTKVLDAAYNNPDLIAQKVKQFATNPEAEQELLQKAQSAFSTVTKNREMDYSNGLTEIQSKYRLTHLSPKNGAGVVMQRPDGETFILSAKGIKDVFTRSTEGLGTNASPFTTTETQLLKNARNLIYQWNDFTPKGLNNLAIRVGKFARPSSQEMANFNRVIYSLKSGLRNYLAERVPEIGAINQAYAKASSFMTRLEREIGPALQSSDKGSVTAAMGKLTNLFSRNNPYREELISQLGEAGGQDLMNEIIGATLSKWGPRWGRFITESLLAAPVTTAGLINGAAGTVGIAGIAGAALASPRITGAAARLAAKAQPFTRGVQALVQKAIPSF